MSDTETSEMEKRLFTVEESNTDAHVAINLILKLLANLRRLDKLDEEELASIATSLIVELGSDKDRFEAWTRLERFLPGFERPETDEVVR